MLMNIHSIQKDTKNGVIYTKILQNTRLSSKIKLELKSLEMVLLFDHMG